MEEANEYDADEFEKDDLVEMAEPQKPIMRQPKATQRVIDKQTNDTTSRADSNSLMREISIRNNK